MLSIVLSILIIASASAAPTSTQSACDANSLAVYNVTFTGLWSKDVFPKQYPLFRPPAQWTKVLGRSHEDGYSMFTMNQTASSALKEFVQTGIARTFDRETQGQQGILDIFTTAAVRHGVGQAKATFFVDGVRSKVSMIARIVPSPDWFVGVDSLEMCQNGVWQDNVNVDLDPLDAGTDQGYTFTSPNWEEKPQKQISLITSHSPSHPANSFYYPDKDKLPTLARLEFVKVRTYSWKDGVRPEVKPEVQRPSVSSELPAAEQPASDSAQDVQNEEASTEERKEEQIEIEETTTVVMATTKTPRGLSRGQERGEGRKEGRGGRGEVRGRGEGREGRRRRKERKNRRRKNRRRPNPNKQVVNALDIADQMVDCQVSEWSEWGACSKTCGFGNRMRQRTIVKKPENFGHPCPLLIEEQLCGSMRNCGWTHFRGLDQRFGGNGTRPDSQQRRIFQFGRQN